MLDSLGVPLGSWVWGGLCTQNFLKKKSTLKLRIFGIFASLSGLFCSGIKAGLKLKYITKITSNIGSDEILNWPYSS